MRSSKSRTSKNSGDSIVEILVDIPKDTNADSYKTATPNRKVRKRRAINTKTSKRPVKVGTDSTMSFKETNSRKAKRSNAERSGIGPSSVESEVKHIKRRRNAKIRDNKRKLSEKPLSDSEQKKIESKLAKVESSVKKSLVDNFGVDGIETLPAIVGDVLPVNSEAMFLSSYMEIYNDVSSLVGVAKGEYLKSKQSRDIYALMSLYSQLRETIADLRGISDVSQQSAIINDEVLEPLMQSVAQVIVDIYFQVSTIFRQLMPEDKVEEAINMLKMVISTHGKRVDDHFKSSREKLHTTIATKQ